MTTMAPLSQTLLYPFLLKRSLISFTCQDTLSSNAFSYCHIFFLIRYVSIISATPSEMRCSVGVVVLLSSFQARLLAKIHRIRMVLLYVSLKYRFQHFRKQRVISLPISRLLNRIVISFSFVCNSSFISNPSCCQTSRFSHHCRHLAC